jgi:tight adherence protein B
MIGLVALLAALAMFALLQAGFVAWRVRSRRARVALWARLGLPVEPRRDDLLRDRGTQRGVASLVEQAGLDWTMAGVGLRAGGLTAFLLVFAMMLGEPSLALVALVAGPGAVWLYLLRARRRRLDRLDAQMPRVLEIMTLALRAGHAVPRAVALAADEVPAPAGTELRRVVEEQALGRPLEEAFVALSRRLPACTGIRALVTSVLVLRSTGGNLVEVLERIAEMLVARTQYRLRLRAVTSEGRSSGVMLSALPVVFALMVAWADPNYMRLFIDEPMGRLMALIGGVLWLLGTLWIRRLVRAGD